MTTLVCGRSAISYSPCASYVLSGCVSGHVAWPDPPKPGADYMTVSWGVRGVWANGGTVWEVEMESRREVGRGGSRGGRENVGQHSQSLVTCSSQLESGLQSKPECYVRGYWSVGVYVGKPSASRSWGGSLVCLLHYCHMVSQHAMQTCQTIAWGANCLVQTDEMSMKIKEIWLVLILELLEWK